MPLFNYKLIRNRRLLSGISVSISPTKGVVVRAPYWMPESIIDNFLKTKSEWIEKHLQRLDSQKIHKKYETGEKHLFFGKEYSLLVKKVNTPGRCQINLVEEQIEIEIYDGFSEDNLPTKIKEALLHWYLEKGIGTITEKVNAYSQKLDVTYSKISLKNVSSIWGSCSPTNCLSFNRKLVMAPHEVVDYVVIHEVCHMVHRNHGPHFWKLVAGFDPLYKTHRHWLRRNNHLLSI